MPDSIFLPKRQTDLEARKVTGDGNCLYHSISLILLGHKILHLLSRLLTTIELFLHPSFYAEHPDFLPLLLLCDISEDIVFTLCLSNTGTKIWEDTKSREDAEQAHGVL